MTTGDALLRRILEVPADDTARLVYADWLQERGQEQWAQFIRATRANWHYVYFLRNELERSIPTATFSGYGVEEGDSPDFGLPRWSFKFPERCAFGRAIWDRGFVSHLVVPLAAFMRHAEALFRAHPIERVTLTDCSPLAVEGYWWIPETPGPPANRIEWEVPRDIIGHGEGLNSEEAAHEWLSRFCVAYGRSLAGLSVTSERHAVSSVS